MARQQTRNQDIGPDVARSNLLTNGGFEIWQRGVGPFTTTGQYTADRWQINLVGTDTLSVSRDTTNIDIGSLAAAACTFVLGTGAGASHFSQPIKLSDYLESLRSRTISLSVRVRTSTANAVRIALSPDGGITWTYSGYHSGSGIYETLTVTLAIAASAPGSCRIANIFAASCTAYIDNAMLVIGTVPTDFIPFHPTDDLARCRRYYQRFSFSSGSYAVFMGHAIGASNAAIMVPGCGPFVTTPSFSSSTVSLLTVINNAYNTWINLTAISLVTYDPTSGTVILYISTAGSLTGGGITGLGSSGGTGWFALEANP